jgi:hypothetical protein
MKVRPPFLGLWRAVLRPLRAITYRAQRHGGVCGVVLDTAGFARQTPESVRIIKIRESHNIRYTLPVCLESEPHWKFPRDAGRTPPDVNILCMDGTRTCGGNGAVISPDGMLLKEYSASFSGGLQGHPLMHTLCYPPVTDLMGTTAILGFPGSDNYFHWLFDVLPRLYALSQSPDLPHTDRYLIDHRTAFQKETLATLGIPREALHQPTGSTHYRCEHMVVPSLMRGISIETCDFLRDRFLSQADRALPSSKLIYVTRQACKRRRVLNEDELLAVLRPMGFEVVNPATMNFDEQVHLFAQARMVVGAHGGALSNLVFCSPGTAVLELFSPRYINVCYWILACANSLKYHYLLGRGHIPGDGRNPLAVYDDIRIELEELKLLVDRFLSAER